MKKILLTLILYASIFNIAHAYTFGPIEGGKCDSCDIWIDQVDSNTGRVNLKCCIGETSYVEREIKDFVVRNCVSRGYQATATMEGMRITEGIWFPDRGSKFTCILPDPYLVMEHSSGGRITSTVNNITEEVRQMAERSCQKRSLGFAELKPSFYKPSSGTQYEFECRQPKIERPAIKAQYDQADGVNQTSKITITEAKQKCVEIGFKPKTEKFGKCVLELTR